MIGKSRTASCTRAALMGALAAGAVLAVAVGGASPAGATCGPKPTCEPSPTVASHGKHRVSLRVDHDAIVRAAAVQRFQKLDQATKTAAREALRADQDLRAVLAGTDEQAKRNAYNAYLAISDRVIDLVVARERAGREIPPAPDARQADDEVNTATGASKPGVQRDAQDSADDVGGQS